MKRMVLICYAAGLGFAVLLLQPVEGNAYTGGAVRFITGVQSVDVEVEYIDVKDYREGTLTVGFTLSGEDPAVIGKRTGYCVKAQVENKQWQQKCFAGDAPWWAWHHRAEITVGSQRPERLLVQAQVRVRYGTGGPDGGLYSSWSPSYGEYIDF